MFLNPAPCTPRLGLSTIVLFSVLLIPAVGSAQLSDAVWSEVISLNADSDGTGGGGVDPLVPEPSTASLSGSGYSIDGSISFASPGPPNATSTMSASHQSGLAFLGGSCVCQILFQFTVVETSPPPVSVASVPVDISATGTADAGGDAVLMAEAFSRFRVGTATQPDLASWIASASNSQGPPSDSFDRNTQIDFAPGAVVDVDLTATTTMVGEGPQPSTSATATAFVDPVFSVADELIAGGGGASYRDHYEVQVSAGYWALGQVPVEPTTWGRIKRLFVD